MGRQYKFRAWDNVENKMHYCGEEIDMFFEVRDNGIECTDIRNVSPGGEGVEPMEHLTYMQYTGLKDKNGEDIYEGDIVNLKKNFISPMDRTAVLHLDQKFIVDKNNGTYGLRKIGELIDKYPHPLYYEVDHIEVIGNIYENSELLEEAE